MAKAHVIYHWEPPDGWWIESPEYPTWAAFGSTRAEVTQLAREGLPYFAEDNDLEIVGLASAPAFTVAVRPRRVRVHVGGSSSYLGYIKATTGTKEKIPA